MLSAHTSPVLAVRGRTVRPARASLIHAPAYLPSPIASRVVDIRLARRVVVARYQQEDLNEEELAERCVELVRTQNTPKPSHLSALSVGIAGISG